jgi:hypothetical protein
MGPNGVFRRINAAKPVPFRYRNDMSLATGAILLEACGNAKGKTHASTPTNCAAWTIALGSA